jgi:hypothetical protein
MVDGDFNSNTTRPSVSEPIPARAENPLPMKLLKSSKNIRPTPAQVGYVASAFPQLATAVDPTAPPATIVTMKLRHIINKLSRLNLTKADREVAALKVQFRREDQELVRQGRGEEIALRNRRLMGIKDGAKGRLVGFGGVRFE